MKAQKKTRRAWLYLTEEDDARLSTLRDRLGPHYDDALILSTLASAGLKLCADIGYRMPMPLKFQMVEPGPTEYNLNERTKPPAKRT